MRFSSLMLLIVATTLVFCTKPTSFEIHASYRSVDNPKRHYSVYTLGTFPPGADIAESYRGRIVVSHAEVQNQLTVKAERFTPKLDETDMPAAFTGVAGQVVDAALLMNFILAAERTATREIVSVEAKELYSVLQAAGMGPKVGMPDTNALEFLSVSNEYQ